VGRFAEGGERRLVGRSDTNRLTEKASRTSVGPTRFETWIGGLVPRALRLYAGAFAAAPSLAVDFGAGHRYNAARAAALAGCGRGTDAIGLGEEERVRLREQARQWLRAELAARARAFDTAPRRPAVPIGWH
jgi:hypothetical protein